MALLPYALRPTVIIRRKAIRQGILGPSTFWKVVAAWVFGRSTLKRFFGRQVETIAVERIGYDRVVQVLTATPLTRKERKRLGITREVLEARAVADIAASEMARPRARDLARQRQAS